MVSDTKLRQILPKELRYMSNRYKLMCGVVKSRGWIKVNDELLKKIHSFIRNHPHVVESPLANDIATVKNQGGLLIKAPKLLLQIPIRVLHNYLVKNLVEARDSTRKVLV